MQLYCRFLSLFLQEEKRRNVRTLRRDSEAEGESMSHLYRSNVMHRNILNEIRVFPPATFSCTLLPPWHLASSTC